MPPPLAFWEFSRREAKFAALPAESAIANRAEPLLS